MFWFEKVNNKKYLSGSLVNLSFAFYAGWPDASIIWWLSYMVIGSALSHFFTIQVFGRLVQNQIDTGSTAKKGKLLVNIFMKGFFLFSSFIFLLTFARARVLHGLLMYIFQLIILFLSIKNIGQLLKKGSTP